MALCNDLFNLVLKYVEEDRIREMWKMKFNTVMFHLQKTVFEFPKQAPGLEFLWQYYTISWNKVTAKRPVVLATKQPKKRCKYKQGLKRQVVR